MKKHILLGAALLSLMAASCSNDDVIDNGTEVVTGKTITLNAAINNGADTRLTYKDNGSSKMSATWSTSEKFIMFQGTSSTISEFKNSADATGKFTCDNLAKGEGKYYAVYGEGITNTNGTLSIDLTAAQVGTSAKNGIKEFMLATANALTSETTLSFDHKLTVLKMTLTLPSDVTGKVSKVTVSGLHKKATYNLIAETPAFDYGSGDSFKGDITATNGGTGFAIDARTHKITAYVAVFPESVIANQVTIKATVGNNEYSYTIASAKTLSENKVVPVNVTLVKRNLKSVYTKKDYFYWDAYTYVTNGDETFGEANYGYNTGSEAASHSCASCPTASQMVAYLKAGVYWDNGAAGANQQTYTLPDGKTYNTGLWVMKKEYIKGFSAGTANMSFSAKLTSGRPDDINKYFFLPAAGFYNYGSFVYAGDYGYYWSNSPACDNEAYCLCFNSSGADMYNSIPRNLGFLPMVAE